MSLKLATAPSSFDIELRTECERAMHAIFTYLGIPKSYMDLDCRTGFMVRAARMFGCKPAIGQAHDYAIKREAKRYAHLEVTHVEGQFDLVTLLQGDPPEDLASRINDKGYFVLASPFPNGKGEVNGLCYNHALTQDLQGAWSLVAEILPGCVQVFEK